MKRKSVLLLASGICISGTLGYMSWGGFQPAKSLSPGVQPVSVEQMGTQTAGNTANTVTQLADQKKAAGEFTKLVPPAQKFEAIKPAQTEPSDDDICARFLSIAELRDLGERDLKLQEFAATLSDRVMGRLLDRLVEIQSNRSVSDSRYALVKLWAGSEPASAAEWAMHLPAGQTASELLSQVATTWAKDDLNSAVHWVEKLPDQDHRKNAIRTAISSISYEAARRTSALR